MRKTFSELEVGYWQGMERVPPSIVEQTVDVLDGFQARGSLNLETAEGVELLRDAIDYAESLLYTWVYIKLLDREVGGRPDLDFFDLSPYDALQLYDAHTYEVQQVITDEITDIRLLGRWGLSHYCHYDMKDPFALYEHNRLILIENALSILAIRALEEVSDGF